MHARVLLIVLAACSSPSVGIQVTTGGEADALTKAPAVDSVLVEEVDQAGNRQQLAQVTLPQTSIDLGNPSQQDLASIQVTGFAQGTPVVTGATPFVTLGALDGLTVPLFVQRRGECARMPGKVADGRSGPVLTRTGEVVFLAGGTTPDGGTPPIDGYELLNLQESGQLPAFSAVLSFAIVELAQATSAGDIAFAWLIHQDSADIIGLPSTGDYNGDGGAPSAFAWSEISGGVTVLGVVDGYPYLVGAGRQGAPSKRLAQFPSDGSMQTAVTSLRQGAAVAATAHGVVLYAGNTLGSDPGAEIVDTGLALTKVGNYAADMTQGLAATAFDDHTVLVTAHPRDGLRRMRLLDLGCDACTTMTAWGPAQTPLLAPQALFKMSPGVFFLVGDDASGTTHVYRVDASSVVELPLKIARHGARAVQIATGAVILVGGGSSTLESCVP